MADLNFPNDVKYAESDEWIRINGDTAVVGISDYAQDALNDIVYVDMPEVGDSFGTGEVFGVVESVKAAADLKLPVGGEVVEINEALEEEPEVINEDPYGKGWIIKIKLSDAGAVSALMDAAKYKNYCDDRE